MKLPRRIMVSINLVAAWRFLRRLFALSLLLTLVGCEEREKEPAAPSRILAIDPASMQCREWSAAEQKFVGPFLRISECSGKPTPEIVDE